MKLPRNPALMHVQHPFFLMLQAVLIVACLFATAPVKAEDFLDPEVAFTAVAKMVEPGIAEVTLTVADGYYLYRERLKFTSDDAQLGEPLLPKGKVKFDETFQKEVETYRHSVVVRIPVKADHAFNLKVVRQGCADQGLCYPPLESAFTLPITIAASATDKVDPGTQSAATVPVTVSGTTESETSTISAALKSGKLLVILPLFFVWGLGLSLTPCVLPMVPILSFIIVGRGRLTRWQLEQLGEVQGAVLAERHLGVGLVQLDVGQVQGMGPETVDLQVDIETFERDLFLARLTDIQAPQGQFETEGIELQALQAGGHRGVVRQLLVGDTQADAGDDQEPEHGVQREAGQQGAEGAFQSFGHVRRRLSWWRCLGVWHAFAVPKQAPCCCVKVGVCEWFLQVQNQGLQRRLQVAGGEVGGRRQHLPFADRTPGFFRATQDLFAPVFQADVRQVVAADQHTVVGGRQQGRLEQALVVAQQVDGAEGALGPGGRVEQHQVVLALFQALVAGQLLPAPLADGQAGELADGGEVVGLDEVHLRQLRIEQAVLPADRQVALGEVQVADLPGTAGRGAEADAAGVGEEVQYALAGAVLADPGAGVAQVEEQQRVLAGVTATDAVVQAAFMAHQVGEGGFVGAIDRVFTIDPRVAPGAVVVDQQSVQFQMLVDGRVQGEQVFAFQGLVEGLHHQLRAVAVDGQAAGTFLAAVEQAIAIGALAVQLGEQFLAMIEGGAQRLVQGRHARRLGVGFGAGVYQPSGDQAHAAFGALGGAVAHGPAQ